MQHKNQQTVLVAEDVEWIRRSMADNLRGLGYKVLESADAASALEAAREQTPDVIVTDEALPTIGELLEAVRRPGALRGVPVTVINPDEPEGTRYGEILVLADYQDIAPLLSNARE